MALAEVRQLVVLHEENRKLEQPVADLVLHQQMFHLPVAAPAVPASD